MLVKFFKRGNSEFARGEDVLDYMLGADWKHDQSLVREDASLIRGNPFHTTTIINNSLHQKKYLSGCLSFHADEIVDEALQEKLMDEFEQCLLPGLDADQYSCYWVKHKDKKDPETGEPRLELNFIFSCSELRQNKKLNVYYHYGDVRRTDLWQSIQNYDHNLFDPKDPIRTKSSTIHRNHRIPDEHRFKKQGIYDFIEQQVQTGAITNRQTMVEVLLANHYTLSRQGETSISIENPEGKNIKLTGDYYYYDFDADKIVHTSKLAQSEQWHKQRQHDMPQMREKFEQLLQKRQADLYERHVKNNPGFIVEVDEPELDLLIEIEDLESPNTSNDINEPPQPSDKLSATTQHPLSVPESMANSIDPSSVSIPTPTAPTMHVLPLVESATKSQIGTKIDPSLQRTEALLPSLSSLKDSLQVIPPKPKKRQIAKIVYLETPTSTLTKIPRLKPTEKHYGSLNFSFDRDTLIADLNRVTRRTRTGIFNGVRDLTKKFVGGIKQFCTDIADCFGSKIGRNGKCRHTLNQGVNITDHATKELNQELENGITTTEIIDKKVAIRTTKAAQTTERLEAIVGQEAQRNRAFTATAQRLNTKINAPRFIEKIEDSVAILKENEPLAKAIWENYQGMCQAGLLEDKGIECYPLFKGFKALTALELSEKLSDDNEHYVMDETQFLYATLNYKQAMLGISEPQSDTVLGQRWVQGTLGFSELLDCQQKAGLMDLKQPEHISLRQTAKLLAKSINDRMSETFKEIGNRDYYIAENYYQADTLVTFTEMLSHIDAELEVTLTPQPKPEVIHEPPNIKRAKPS